MPRNFKLPEFGAHSLTDPKVMVRVVLGVLFLANLVAAAFAFHWVDASPDAVNQALLAAQNARATEQARLLKSRVLAGNIARGKGEGEAFLATYMTSRRRTYSTIIGEVTELAKTAGMKSPGGTIALEPIQGSDDLDLMSITFNLEGGYAELRKLVNLLDRSPRFLILETLTVTPRANSGTLAVTFKLDTFVREDEPRDAAAAKDGAM